MPSQKIRPPINLIYLDQSIIDEWLKFKSTETSLTSYVRGANKVAISRDLETFGKILDVRSLTFLYSHINVLECSTKRKDLFDNLVSSDNFLKVPPVGLSICMVDHELPKDNILEIGEVRSYFASHIKKFGIKEFKGRRDFKKYMRKKFFDEIHIDSAIRTAADVFITIDFNLLKRIKTDSEFQDQFGMKISFLSPSECYKKIIKDTPE